MAESAIWLGESDIASLVTLNDTIDALETSLRALARDEGLNIPKALAGFDDGSSLHSLGSVLPAAGYGGYKNWINTKRGAKAVYTLFDTRDGRLLAIMEANVLGQLRTAAMTGLGTRWVAPAAANDMAIIGSGRQALMQVAAVHAVRPLSRLRVWSPTPERRTAFASALTERFQGLAISVAETLEAATEDASIVTLVTRAREPFLSAAILKPGAHINAIGAILPENAEVRQDVFERAGCVVVDDLVNVQRGSREFREHYEHARHGDWSGVQLLGEVIDRGPLPAGTGDLTLFKAMGMGLSDLAVAQCAYERARANDLGLPFALSRSAPIRWSA